MTFEEIDKVIKATFSLHLSNYKHSEKEYLKEYQLEEIHAIYTQLTSLRNKAIFLLTIHGMRIDEILSIKKNDYNALEQTIKPSRSKGKGKGKKRTLALRDECVTTIENYILNERNPIEVAIKKDSPYLFVNLRITETDTELKPLKYNNIYRAFQTAIKKAGISNARIHTGRSHYAIELLRHVNKGDIGLTDEHMRIIMGWKSIESAEPYIKIENERQAIDLSRSLALMKKDFQND